MSTFVKIIGVLLLGALGALIFNVVIFPYMLTNSYFERFQFVKYFKDGKIIVNPKESVYVQENSAIVDAIQRVKMSVVAIQSNTLGLRSGLVVTSDGLVATTASIITNGKFGVFLQGESVAATVVKTDYKNNVALLKLSKNDLQTVGFADSNMTALGQRVFLVAPLLTVSQPGTETVAPWFVNEGIITEVTADRIKTNMVEKPSATGSPLFNPAGELVGLNVVDSEGKISTIPISSIQALLGL